ncbi:MAG TPA: TlpA disulfide reductase family protein [Kiritimatiellia bacterium]|nr:TlpA disulfide reductase family protein [Kiritimatiellia bacterium]HPS09368.1 TlpA disulfide reductase family protein [Kiritimatiellia bacterium]
MKNTLAATFFSFLAGAAWAALPPSESDDFNGQEAPAFSVKPVKGEEVALKDWKGHPVLVSFFASWCPPCRSEIKELLALNKDYGKDGLRVIGIAMDPLLTPDTVGDVKPLAEKLAITYPVALATKKINDDYHFKGIPTTVLVGPDGKIAKTFYGLHDAKTIGAELKKLLPPPEATAK